jgi:hypothetical protein
MKLATGKRFCLGCDHFLSVRLEELRDLRWIEQPIRAAPLCSSSWPPWQAAGL